MFGEGNRARIVFGLALIVRVALFPFADNKQGDAPMRALIAQRLNLDGQAAGDPRTFCQFGPLHMTLMRPFLWLDPDLSRSSRELSLLVGLLTFLPFMRLARRLAGQRGADLAGFALAVSPLHIQLSITAASEALYLLLVVAALDQLLTALDAPRARWGPYALAGIFASLSSVTRYDAWVMWPVAAGAAAWWWGRGRRAGGGGPVLRGPVLGGLALFVGGAALLPAAWLLWSGVVAHDPFFFARYISNDHAHLGAAITDQYGSAGARGRQLGIWSLSFAAAMTPPMLWGAAHALRSWRTLTAPHKLVVFTALAPPLLYVVDGLVSLHFEPLSRFALVPGVLLLPLAAGHWLSTSSLSTGDVAVRVRRWVAASAVLGSVAVLAVAWAGTGRCWGGAESLGPLTRLDDEDRRLAAYLQQHRHPGEPIMVDPCQFMDIAVTEASGTPAAQSVTLVLTREPGRSVAQTIASTGARWLAVRDDSWAPRLASDWPAGALRFGRWRLLHVADAPPGSG
ncbi:MAG TPA: glycosyltransferase family 39 protein [Polyangia bacterium]|nr:glycosyltransferase family 39 protein [Polyangia bacterium]